jgi:AcrR family transcriptional regulator
MAMVKRRRLGAAERRQSILSAAIPEFTLVGYERARVSDIADKVGVTEPVIFQNFATKCDLFVACLDQASEEAVRYLGNLGEHSLDAAAMLSVLLAQDLQDRLHNAGGLGRMFAEAAANSSVPAIHEAGRRAHDRIVGTLAEQLRGGQAEGSIRGDIDAIKLAWLVISQIHARQFRQAHGETSVPLEDAFLQALFAALRPTTNQD